MFPEYSPQTDEVSYGVIAFSSVSLVCTGEHIRLHMVESVKHVSNLEDEHEATGRTLNGEICNHWRPQPGYSERSSTYIPTSHKPRSTRAVKPSLFMKHNRQSCLLCRSINVLVHFAYSGPIYFSILRLYLCSEVSSVLVSIEYC